MLGRGQYYNVWGSGGISYSTVYTVVVSSVLPCWAQVFGMSFTFSQSSSTKLPNEGGSKYTCGETHLIWTEMGHIVTNYIYTFCAQCVYSVVV